MSEVKQNTYWKSLMELGNNQGYQEFVEREFPENASELTDGFSRRSFLAIMGSAVLLASCDFARRPVQKILPYSKQPEDVVPGRPLYYASAMPFLGSLTGLVVENNEGRPTKVEGNELHPGSRGATSAFNQASVLGMYDPDRSRHVLKDGDESTLDDFVAFAAEHFKNTGQRIAFISESNSSITLNSLRRKALSQFNNATWTVYEPFGEDNALKGNEIAFGQRLRTHNKFDEADVVVSLNDDFMASAHPNSVENAKTVTSKRKVTDTNATMSRIYSVEDNFTLTGSFADNRLRLKASQIGAFTLALGAALSKKVSGLNAFSGVNNEFSNHEWVKALADELSGNQGNSIVTIGLQHTAEEHALVAAINTALGNNGKTVEYLDVPNLADEGAAFASVVADMKAGKVDTVVMIGTNPAYTAQNVEFAEALKNVKTTVHLSDYVDETSAKVNWHVNRAHYLETWGDGFSFSGASSVIQPQIQPLYNGLSEIEFLNVIVTGSQESGYNLVQDTFKGIHGASFDKNWRKILHDGIDSKDNFKAVQKNTSSALSNAVSAVSKAEKTSGMEVVIRPDGTIYDGRFANIAWLQEMPDPMTKITWDNVALVSPSTARELGVKNEEMLKITSNGKSIEIAAWIHPGHADGTITLSVGYGRDGIGRVANRYIDFTAGGVDTYPLMGNKLYAEAKVEKIDGKYKIACVQDHHSIEGRDMFRMATLDEYKENPNFASFLSQHGYEVPGKKEAEILGRTTGLVSLFDEQKYPKEQPQWGMAIDLNSCFGCGVCIIACQSENNIPTIGKKEVLLGREMHWIRNDRYYVGDDAGNPMAVHQPVPCMHCEMAPCEQVCPVAATTHSDDGMNQMTYNRCIGTRYCANNCPYKVRRFNFFNYTKEFLTTGTESDIVTMAMNPEVTIRFRGVMEKCTYCVQRVNRAKIDAKVKTGSMKPSDGMVKTACQQACPADAIYFGDLTDENSVVTKMKRNERSYLMLEELNTRPRTSYMAKLRNPNPSLA